jgi:tryptophanyl-tRNA synthetase
VVTDSDRSITYDPATRPGVSALLDLAALCLDRTPAALAEEIGAGGAGRLKQIATDAVNERFAAHRERRRELAADPGYVLEVLRAGNERAGTIAAATLTQVRAAMGTVY